MSLITMNCIYVFPKNSCQYCELNNKLCIGDCNCDKRIKKYDKTKVMSKTITENDLRSDKFIPMTRDELQKCFYFSLRNGDRKICYKVRKKDKDECYGGMADTLEDALYWCRKFYSEDTDIELSIGDFTSAPCIWSTKDILYELGIISEEEYNKYLDEIDFD